MVLDQYNDDLIQNCLPILVKWSAILKSFKLYGYFYIIFFKVNGVLRITKKIVLLGSAIIVLPSIDDFHAVSGKANQPPVLVLVISRKHLFSKI